MRFREDKTRVGINYPYIYDLDGNRTQENINGGDAVSGGSSVFFTYNADNELATQYQINDGSSTHVYDTTYTYDNNGSETEVATTGSGGPANATYTYNVRNKMVGYSSGPTSATYVYDDAGNRVQETTGGTTTFYLTDDQNPTGYAQPIETWTNTSDSLTGATHAMTYLIGDHVFGQDTGSGTVDYYLVDGHNSTRAVINTSGTIVTSLSSNSIGNSGWMDYDAFGDAIGGWSQSAAASAGVIDQYAGDAVFDPISGLYMNGDGTRDRSSFRFIQMDSLTITPGDLENANLYLYADANAVNGFDPSGHDDGIGALDSIGFSLGISDAMVLAAGTEPSTQPGNQNFATPQNIMDLARIIFSEASVGNATEREAVAATVRNRLIRDGVNTVRSVWGAYSHKRAPSSLIYVDIATVVLGPNYQDITNGATHYYSPRSEPKAGDNTAGYDVGGGLELVPPLTVQNYRPGWANTYTYVNIQGVRPSYFKFYVAPGTGPVQ